MVGCLTVSDSPLSDPDNRLHIKDEHGHSSQQVMSYRETSRAPNSGRSRGSTYHPMMTSPPDLISDTLAKVKHSLSSSHDATDHRMQQDTNANIPKQEIMTSSTSSSSSSSSSSSRRSGRTPKLSAPLQVDTSLSMTHGKMSQISPSIGLSCQKSRPGMLNLNNLPSSLQSSNHHHHASNKHKPGAPNLSSSTSRHYHHHHHHHHHHHNNNNNNSSSSSNNPQHSQLSPPGGNNYNHNQALSHTSSQQSTSYPNSNHSMESQR